MEDGSEKGWRLDPENPSKAFTPLGGNEQSERGARKRQAKSEKRLEDGSLKQEDGSWRLEVKKAGGWILKTPVKLSPL